MVLRCFNSVLLLYLLLSMCNHGSAVKDLKEQHSTIDFHKDCDEAKEKGSSTSSYFARLESSYKPSYGGDETVKEKMTLVESKYKPGYGVDEVDEEKMAQLESKYKTSYGVDEADGEKIDRLESKYKPGNEADEEKMTREKMAQMERKYKPDYGVEGRIAHLESKYKPNYGVDEVEEKSSTPASSKTMEHHHHDIQSHQHDDDIRSEDVGVFTIDDVLSFHAGRKLSTFFSIRKPDLYPGFLPREIADSIPFSSSEITEILQIFSVSPDSPKSKAIKKTIRKCETNPVEGETKICATSSESMLEFLKNAFGEADFKLISTTHPTMKSPILQSYTVLEPAREIESQRKVACHPLPYLYAVYMCHYDNTETKTFKVALVGDNGDKVNALIVCHMDTSAWSPKHTAFSFLGTKPGIPVCHTFSEGHVVWVQSSKPVVTM